MVSLIWLRKSPTISDSVTVNIVDVILTSDVDYNWTISGFNVNFDHCQLESLQLLFMKNDGDSENTTQNLNITFYNSSFKSVDLQPETRAKIIDCYIDAKKQPRPTLFTSNNSDIVIHNSTFLRFVNSDGPTILDAQINCDVSVENSIFVEHLSWKSVLFVHDKSNMKISHTTFHGNIALSEGGAVRMELYSRLDVTYCLFDDNSAWNMAGAINGGYYVMLDIKDTNFYNNKAIHGGAIFVIKDIQLLVTDCTLDGNLAVGSSGAIAGRDKVTLEINNTKFNNNCNNIIIIIIIVYSFVSSTFEKFSL